MAFQFNVQGCCEASGCTLFTDSFERPDASEPGNGWEVRAGSWPLVSGNLAPSSAGLCVADFDHSDGDFTFSAYARSVGGASTLRLIVDYASDDNYVFVEWNTSSADGHLAIGRRTAGVDSIDVLLPRDTLPGNWYTLSACYNGSDLTATLENDVGYMAAAVRRTIVISHGAIGLGVEAIGGTIEISGTAVRDYGGEMCPVCLDPIGCTACLHNFAPNAFRVEIEGFTGSELGCDSASCEQLNGTFLVQSFMAQCGGRAVNHLNYTGPTWKVPGPDFECGDVADATFNGTPWTLEIYYAADAPLPPPLDFLDFNYVYVKLIHTNENHCGIGELGWLLIIDEEYIVDGKINCFALFDNLELTLHPSYTRFRTECGGGTPVCTDYEAVVRLTGLLEG